MRYTPTIREVMVAKFGSAVQYQVRSEGDVQVYGTMPNTDQVGWYFVGWVDDILLAYDIERAG